MQAYAPETASQLMSVDPTMGGSSPTRFLQQEDAGTETHEADAKDPDSH
jgi:hypothetical protein